MPYSIVTEPASEPISLADAKTHLRVDGSDEDSYITTLIIVARQHAETVTRRALISQTWDLKYDAFPSCSSTPIEVPFPPLQSVTSITYIDTDGVSQTWSSSEYTVDSDSQPGRIIPAYNEIYPSTRSVINAVTARVVVGYGDNDTDVPEQIRQAMLQFIGHLFENRVTVEGGAALREVPMTTEYLLRPYRDLRFFS